MAKLKERICIIGKEGKISIYLNQNKKIIKNEKCKLIYSEEECKEIFLEYVWKIKPRKTFPLTLWEEMKEKILQSENFQYEMSLGDIDDRNRPFTYAQSIIYIPELFCH